MQNIKTKLAPLSNPSRGSIYVTEMNSNISILYIIFITNNIRKYQFIKKKSASRLNQEQDSDVLSNGMKHYVLLLKM